MRRYLAEVLGERKLEVISQIAAEDMVDHSQPEPGRKGLERHAGGFLAAVPDAQIVIDHIVAGEDIVVGIWHWRGTPVVEFFGVPPTGREVETVPRASSSCVMACSSTTRTSAMDSQPSVRWALNWPCLPPETALYNITVLPLLRDSNTASITFI